MGRGTGGPRRAPTVGHYVDSRVSLVGGVFGNTRAHKLRRTETYRVDKESPPDKPALLTVTYVDPKTHEPLRRNQRELKGGLSIKLHRNDITLSHPKAVRERN